MAEAATPESVNRENGNIDYSAALEIIQTDILALQSDQKKLAKEAGTSWKQVEDMGVNKAGAQAFAGLLKKPVDIRRDMFRTFINLAKAANWFEWLDDLVDRSQAGPVVAAPAAPAAPRANVPAANREPPAPDHPADDSDLAGPPERVNLKTSWVQRLKTDADPTDDASWEDVRQATPKEMAAERERLADFDDKGPGPQPEPEVAATKAAAREKVGGRRGKLSIAGGTDAKK